MVIYKDESKLARYITINIICVLSIGFLLTVLSLFITQRSDEAGLNVVFIFGLSCLILAIGLILSHYIYEIYYYINQPKVLMNITFEHLIIYYNESIITLPYSAIKINYHPNQDDKDAFFIKKGKEYTIYNGSYYSVIIQRGRKIYEIKNVKNERNVRKYIYNQIVREKAYVEGLKEVGLK